MISITCYRHTPLLVGVASVVFMALVGGCATKSNCHRQLDSQRVWQVEPIEGEFEAHLEWHPYIDSLHGELRCRQGEKVTTQNLHLQGKWKSFTKSPSIPASKSGSKSALKSALKSGEAERAESIFLRIERGALKIRQSSQVEECAYVLVNSNNGSRESLKNVWILAGQWEGEAPEKTRWVKFNGLEGDVSHELESLRLMGHKNLHLVLKERLKNLFKSPPNGETG